MDYTTPLQQCPNCFVDLPQYRPDEDHELRDNELHRMFYGMCHSCNHAWQQTIIYDLTLREGFIEEWDGDPDAEGEEFIHGIANVSEDDLNHIVGEGDRTLCGLTITRRIKGLVEATCPVCIEIHKQRQAAGE